MEENVVVWERQIGCCQIFEIMGNEKYVVVVNYDGRVTILDKGSRDEVRWFYAPGKEIRHVALNDKYLVLSV